LATIPIDHLETFTYLRGVVCEALIRMLKSDCQRYGQPMEHTQRTSSYLLMAIFQVSLGRRSVGTNTRTYCLNTTYCQ